MLNKFKKSVIALFLFMAAVPLSAQTIAEKKAGISKGVSELSPELQKFLIEVNKENKERQAELKKMQDTVLQLYLQNAPPQDYHHLLMRINDAKENIRILQESWREMVTKPGLK